MLGVFEFASRAIEAPSVELLRTVAIVGNHVSQFSDRFQTEQALRESDAQKAAILSNALDGIITVDDAGRIIELKALFMTVWCPDSRSVESNCGIPRG